MGCWGIGTFENDDAADWVWSLEERDGRAVLEHALAAPSDGGYFEASKACETLVAAEVVAALLGHPATDLPLEVARWGGHCAFVESLSGDGFAERWVADRLGAALPRR